MKEFKRIFKKINMHDFLIFLFFPILLVVTLVTIRSFEFTQARYESQVDMALTPNIAFFVVDVGTQEGTIKLESMIPRSDPYEYEFNVSNFNQTKHANVDLTYSIELITTTNMPLKFRVYKGNNLILNEEAGTETTDDNGVYYRHMLVSGVSTMLFSNNVTDTYKLWVYFPESNANNPEGYAGVIDLVDIKINAEQVV